MTLGVVRTDQELWDLAVRGESWAFGELFERHHRSVYNYCFRRTASWEMAEDLTSQVFLETWRGRRNAGLTIDSLLPWLLGVASRLTRHEWRTRARRAAAHSRLPALTVVPDHAGDVAGRVDDERRMAHVLEAVHRLPGAEQDVLALCVFAELDYQATATALGIPVGTVRSRLSRARNHLRQVTGADTSHDRVSYEEEGEQA
ncbi:MAG: RNA polymerase sigma factor [Dermatophilaceae bacterium]